MTVPTGEPDSVSTFESPLIFTPGGFPTCTADLQARNVTCTGLVPGRHYTINDGSSHPSATADDSGTASTDMAVKRGDVVTLTNSGHNTLTTLHVAHLRVDIMDGQDSLSGGTCQAGDYYGAPLSSAPTSDQAGAPSPAVNGVALTGEICPTGGKAAGFSAAGPFIQTDEFSQGATQTEVPDIKDTSPMEGETVYGRFTALAETDLGGTPDKSKVSLSIKRSVGGGHVVFRASNVNTASGVAVKGLKPGTYTATWTLHDANGDTRTEVTRFIVQPGIGPAGPKPHVTCKRGKHGKITCTVKFPKSKKGRLQVRLSRAGQVAAMGHSNLSGGVATVTLREVRHMTAGTWTATLVLSGAHQQSSTTRLNVRLS
jgi:hypothetical protein